MAWAEIDDLFYSHPKVVEAGSLGVALFACALSYCSRHSTSGFVPMAQVRQLINTDNPQAVAERLVAVGLWERQPAGYQITRAVGWRFHSDPGNQDLRKTREYKMWRMAVMERDRHTCQLCGAFDELHVHHIVGWAQRPDKRYNVENGIVLCRQCHSEAHGRQL